MYINNYTLDYLTYDVKFVYRIMEINQLIIRTTYIFIVLV